MPLRLGPYRKGEPYVYAMSWIDDDESAEGYVMRKGVRQWKPASRWRRPLSTRGFLRVGWPSRKRPVMDFHWEVVVRRSLRDWEFGWRFETQDYNDRDYAMSAHLGWLTVYLSMTTALLPKPKRATDWHLYYQSSPGALPDVSVYFSLGSDSWAEATGRRKWNPHRNGVLGILDTLFGRWDYRTKVLDEYDAVIPLPERHYLVHVKIEEGRRRRKRWPVDSREVHASIDASKDPLPHPGNMESDYWNGDDAIFGMGVKAGTQAEVVGAVVEHVLAERLRYGGTIDWRPAQSTSA